MLVMILILCLKPINNVLTSIEVNNYEYHEIKLRFFRFWAKLPPEISLVTPWVPQNGTHSLEDMAKTHDAIRFLVRFYIKMQIFSLQ